MGRAQRMGLVFLAIGLATLILFGTGLEAGQKA